MRGYIGDAGRGFERINMPEEDCMADPQGV